MERFELSNYGIKTHCVTASLHPYKSIAFHPFYGTPYIFPKLAWVATPTLILLYHSHWLLLVTWDFRRWSHTHWLVYGVLHCYRVDFYKTFSPWKGLIWNLQTFNLVEGNGFEPLSFGLWGRQATTALTLHIVRLVWACHQEAAEICYLGYAESATTRLHCRLLLPTVYQLWSLMSVFVVH